jgi:hypothetical protein
LIHIATMHYRDDRWIDLQQRYLERHTHEPYRTYASLEGVDSSYLSRFDQAWDETGPTEPPLPNRRIEPKLDRLTDTILSVGEPEDLMVFMHGDTIPITDWVPPIRAMTQESGLAGICREEIDEPIPHWSFVATTVGFWHELGADWSRGPAWPLNGKEESDTGATLWRRLETQGVPWRRLLRSNQTNLNPLLFGVYGNLVYHHGAAFRPSITRWDSAAYVHLPIPLRNFAGVRKRLANVYQSKRLIRRIRRDEHFYEELTGGPV